MRCFNPSQSERDVLHGRLNSGRCLKLDVQDQFQAGLLEAILQCRELAGELDEFAAAEFGKDEVIELCVPKTLSVLMT